MQIMHILLDNCRESDRQIGKKIGISGSAVNSRIQKMLKNKIIEKFALKIEPPVLGYNVIYIVVTGQDLTRILKQVKLVGEPFFVVPCVGGITVCSIVIKENVKQKIELAKNLMKDVRILSIFEAENPGIRSDITKTDLKIINELMESPRKKIEDIASSISLSTKTVARSLEKFYKDEAILFTLIYDPTKCTPYIPYTILIWVKDDFEIVLKKVKKDFSKWFLQKPFLAKNQIVLFMFSNQIYKIDEITQKIQRLDGINSADLFIPKKITLPQKWILDSIKSAKTSKKLHLMYQTN